MSRYVLKTFGCKANWVDSQGIEAALRERGWTPSTETTGEGEASLSEVDLCIVNSCTVTDEADRQVRKMARKLARENPKARVVVTGCSAEVNPEGMAKELGVHFVVGNQNKDRLAELVLEAVKSPSISSHILKQESGQILGTVQNYSEIRSKHPTEREWPAASDGFPLIHAQNGGFSDKTRAFIKIQEGCNSFCTYCIIPYGRGPSRSVPEEKLLEQIQSLTSTGTREVILTGTNIGDYGFDLAKKTSLGNLIRRIFGETDLQRLRVSSLDPTEITDEIIQLMSDNPRFCPHFHVSLQSPHSRILRLMKRKYQFSDVKSCLYKIASIRNGIEAAYVGMDVITGFPGETAEEFEWSHDALQDLPWTRLHVFPYSEREGTPATRLPDSVPPSVRSTRAKRLNELSMNRLKQHYSEVIDKCKNTNSLLQGVLLEKGSRGWIPGYTPNYLRVLLPDSASETLDAARNQLVNVRPLDLMVDPQGNDVALIGRVCS